jgi:hypothetical protein
LAPGTICVFTLKGDNATLVRANPKREALSKAAMLEEISKEPPTPMPLLRLF